MKRFLPSTTIPQTKTEEQQAPGIQSKCKILQEEKTHLWNLPKMSTNEDNYTILNFNFKRNLTNKEKLNWLNNWVIKAKQGWLLTQSRNSSVILTMRAKSLWNYSTFPQPNLIKQLLTNLSSMEPKFKTAYTFKFYIGLCTWDWSSFYLYRNCGSVH